MRKKIKKRVVDAALPGEKDRFTWDTDVKGFGLKVTPAGGKIYVVQYRLPGNPVTRRHTIGKHGSPWTAEEARGEALRILRDVAAGFDPAAKPAQTGSVAVIAGEFVEKHQRARGNRSVAQTERFLRHDILPTWGDRPISEITRRDVLELLDSIVERGAPVSAIRVHAILRTMFRWCVDRGIISEAPTNRVPKPAAEGRRDRVLTDDELAEVWRAAKAVGWPFGQCIQLLILTAQRRDEVAQMRWPEVSLDRTVWTLPGERAKNGHAHEVALAPAANDVLRGLPRHDGTDLVFTTTGRTPISGFSTAKRALDKHILDTRRQAAIERGDDPATVTPMPHWTLHDLRRTSASGMAGLRIAPHVIDRVLNHVQGTIRGVAAIYNRHAYLDERRRALEAWAAYVVRLVDRSANNAARV